MVHSVTEEKAPQHPLRVIGYRGLVEIHHLPGRGNPRPVSRSACHGLSPGARRRMLTFMGQCNAPPRLFVTLTYPGRFPSLAQAKEDLRVWAQRLQRIADKTGIRVGMLWRLERQRRGAPHFHILVWWQGSARRCLFSSVEPESMSRALAAFRPLRRLYQKQGRLEPCSFLDWLGMLSATWSRRCSPFADDLEGFTRNGVDVKLITDRDGAAAYVSKYVAKPDDGGIPGSDRRTIFPTGRMWGTRGDRQTFDRRPLALMALPPTGGPGSWLHRAWKELRHAWGKNAEEEGWCSYTVFLRGDGFWELIEWMTSHASDLWERPPPLIEQWPRIGQWPELE